MTDENDINKSNPMWLWSLVDSTDPAHTKEVNLGRKFNAIDPYQQILRATTIFGPAGTGWGWRLVSITPLNESKQVAVAIDMWIEDSDKTFVSVGQCGMYTDRAMSKPDNDCVKKAMTDAITKGLSYLGFNADVFLGMFDDSKYVAEQRQKYEDQHQTDKENKKKPRGQVDQEWADGLISLLESAVDLKAVNEIADDNRDEYNKLRKRNIDLGKKVKACLDNQRKKFGSK